MAPWQHCKCLDQEPSKYGPAVAEVVSAGQQSAAKIETDHLTNQLPWIHTQLCKTEQGDPAPGLGKSWEAGDGRDCCSFNSRVCAYEMFTDSMLCSLSIAFSRLLLEAGSVLTYFSSCFSSPICSITLYFFQDTFLSSSVSPSYISLICSVFPSFEISVMVAASCLQQ